MQENQETEQSFLLPDWDPGLRSSKLSDNQKRYLTKKGPHQPTLATFSQKDSIPVSKQRQFTTSWYNSRTLNIAYAKTLCTALSALYSGKMDRILLGLKPEFVVCL